MLRWADVMGLILPARPPTPAIPFRLLGGVSQDAAQRHRRDPQIRGNRHEPGSKPHHQHHRLRSKYLVVAFVRLFFFVRDHRLFIRKRLARRL